jgi:hypothetical protein
MATSKTGDRSRDAGQEMKLSRYSRMMFPVVLTACLMPGPEARALTPEELSSRKISSTDVLNAACSEIWFLRNSIYNTHGFCFRSRKARELFDNSDCTTKTPPAMSEIEQHNADLLGRLEKLKGCKPVR